VRARARAGRGVRWLAHAPDARPACDRDTLCRLPPQAYNLQGYVTRAYKQLLHEANDSNKYTSVVGGLSMGYL
jgi:hypothetical protein